MSTSSAPIGSMPTSGRPVTRRRPVGFLRSMLGDRDETERLRAALTADLEAITTGLTLLDD